MKIYSLKLLWWERDRVRGAYKHFRKYRANYRQHRKLYKLFNGSRLPLLGNSAIYRACSYTLNNPRTFDGVYFKDMARAFNKEAAK